MKSKLLGRYFLMCVVCLYGKKGIVILIDPANQFGDYETIYGLVRIMVDLDSFARLLVS